MATHEAFRQVLRPWVPTDRRGEQPEGVPQKGPCQAQCLQPTQCKKGPLHATQGRELATRSLVRCAQCPTSQMGTYAPPAVMAQPTVTFHPHLATLAWRTPLYWGHLVLSSQVSAVTCLCICLNGPQGRLPVPCSIRGPCCPRDQAQGLLVLPLFCPQLPWSPGPGLAVHMLLR